MVVKLSPELETALRTEANRQGISPETLAVGVLQSHFLGTAVMAPRDDWERRLLGAATDCGVVLSHEATSSEGLYE